jgi:hypothetical protein
MIPTPLPVDGLRIPLRAAFVGIKGLRSTTNRRRLAAFILAVLSLPCAGVLALGGSPKAIWLGVFGLNQLGFALLYRPVDAARRTLEGKTNLERISHGWRGGG